MKKIKVKSKGNIFDLSQVKVGFYLINIQKYNKDDWGVDKIIKKSSNKEEFELDEIYKSDYGFYEKGKKATLGNWWNVEYYNFYLCDKKYYESKILGKLVAEEL